MNFRPNFHSPRWSSSTIAWPLNSDCHFHIRQFRWTPLPLSARWNILRVARLARLVTRRLSCPIAIRRIHHLFGHFFRFPTMNQTMN
jgi:hypothetical protein